jgi:hypothetical protein
VHSSDPGKLRDTRPQLYRAVCETLFGPIGANIGAIAGNVQMRDLYPPKGEFGPVIPLFVAFRRGVGAGDATPVGPATSLSAELANLDPDADLL